MIPILLGVAALARLIAFLVIGNLQSGKSWRESFEKQVPPISDAEFKVIDKILV
jgi:hypothetical protein